MRRLSQMHVANSSLFQECISALKIIERMPDLRLVLATKAFEECDKARKIANAYSIKPI